MTQTPNTKMSEVYIIEGLTDEEVFMRTHVRPFKIHYHRKAEPCVGKCNVVWPA